jgi:hypothetical protein
VSTPVGSVLLCMAADRSSIGGVGAPPRCVRRSADNVRQHVQQEEYLHAFLAWLPSDLHDAPGIDWSALPPDVMLYCIRAVGAGPDVPYLASAVAAANAAIRPNSLLQLVRNLHALLTALRTVCGMEQVTDLRREELWNEFSTLTQSTRTRSVQLSAYSASGKHYQRYLERLSSQDASVMQHYRLPSLPPDFLKRVGKANELNARSLNWLRLIRKTLLPLVPALHELIVLRKRALEQVLDTFHHAQQQIEQGAASLPLAFELSVLYPTLSQEDGGRGNLQRHERVLHFWLWNKRSWVLGHRDRYSPQLISKVQKARGPYAPEQERYFLEFDGAARDLLWYGDLVEQRLLQHLSAEQQSDPPLSARQQLARSLGCSYGCATGIGGLLQSDSVWLAVHARAGDLLFEPEALFRGSLYAAALTILALTSGGSTGELLQISEERWVNDPEGTFQRLVPERAQNGEEVLLEIDPRARNLLREIEHGLVGADGKVPEVPEARQVERRDQLTSEGVLFQWRKQRLSRRDTEILVLFLLHGVDVRSVNGAPIPLTLENLRLGGNIPIEERARALNAALGFNQTILAHLSRSTLDAYCRTLYAYFEFAGTYEAALQPLTLARWMVQMLDQGYERETVNRQRAIVLHLFREAWAQGFIDRDSAEALQGVEEISAKMMIPVSREPDDSRPHMRYSSVFKKCGKLDCSVCREGGKQGHGPYWYGFWSQDGKQESCYIGRVKNERTIEAAFNKKVERMRARHVSELGSE